MRVGWLFVALGGAGALGCGASDEDARVAGPASLSDEADPAQQGDDQVVSGEAMQLTPEPTLEAGRYVFRMGDIELVVDPAIGGRITRFSLAGENILTGPEVVAGGEGSLPNMYGSTFWTSPQSAWGWPPEVALDSAAQRAIVAGAVLELASDPGETTGYSVTKRFWTDAARDVVTIEYSIENQSASLPAAPWEISRVPKEGFVFFAAAAPALPQSTLPSSLVDGIAWIDIALAPSEDSKLFQDGGEGWLAYVYRDLVFIKTFDDLPANAAAPEEAEIEIFVNGKYDYVEIEQQGAYVLPPAGSATSWRVSWRLERLPAGMAARVGSAELVAWVRSRVASMR